MARSRRSRNAAPEPPRRRRASERRGRGGTNLGPLIGFTLAIGVVILIAIVAMKVMQKEAVEPKNDAEPAKAAPAPELQSRPESKTPSGRPAPDLTGPMIIDGDAIFKEVKRLFAAARRAKQGGKEKEHDSLLNECRQTYDKIGRHFHFQAHWLLDAQGNNWEIPKTYATLQRRLSRYADWRRKNLPGEAGELDKK